MLILPYSIVDCNLFFVHSRPPLFLQEKQHQTQAEQIRAPARLPRGGHLIEQVLHPQGTAKWAVGSTFLSAILFIRFILNFLYDVKQEFLQGRYFPSPRYPALKFTHFLILWSHEGLHNG